MNHKKFQIAGIALSGFLILSLSFFFIYDLSHRNMASRHGRWIPPHLEPNDWMAMQRSYPYGRINPDAYLNA
ncbi:MAG: hypothetical protein WCI71_10985, partial [Bacteroidota bacterium]